MSVGTFVMVSACLYCLGGCICVVEEVMDRGDGKWWVERVEVVLCE